MSDLDVLGRPIMRRPSIDTDRSPRDWLLAFVAGAPAVLRAQLNVVMALREDVPATLVEDLHADGAIEQAPRLRSQGEAFSDHCSGIA